MSLIFLLLSGLAAAAASDQLTVGELKGSSTPVLAKRLLPPEVQPRIVGGDVHRRWLPGQAHRVVFWEAAEPAGTTLCRRRFHGIDLSNPTASGHPGEPTIALTISERSSGLGYRSSYPDPATSASCAKDQGWITPTPARTTASLTALDQLTKAMRAAAGTAPLTFEIRCDEEQSGNACADRRRALASLPLDALFGVSFDTGHQVTVSETPRGDGGTIRVRQMVPSPDGVPPTPTLEFGMSAPDGRSWRVELVGPPDRLVEVRMSRTTIIYH